MLQIWCWYYIQYSNGYGQDEKAIQTHRSIPVKCDNFENSTGHLFSSMNAVSIRKAYVWHSDWVTDAELQMITWIKIQKSSELVYF